MAPRSGHALGSCLVGCVSSRGRAPADAAETNRLGLGLRSILARHIIFHWNRIKFSPDQQAIWSRADVKHSSVPESAVVQQLLRPLWSRGYGSTFNRRMWTNPTRPSSFPPWQVCDTWWRTSVDTCCAPDSSWGRYRWRGTSHRGSASRPRPPSQVGISTVSPSARMR